MVLVFISLITNPKLMLRLHLVDGRMKRREERRQRKIRGEGEKEEIRPGFPFKLCWVSVSLWFHFIQFLQIFAPLKRHKDVYEQ